MSTAHPSRLATHQLAGVSVMEGFQSLPSCRKESVKAAVRFFSAILSLILDVITTANGSAFSSILEERKGSKRHPLSNLAVVCAANVPQRWKARLWQTRFSGCSRTFNNLEPSGKRRACSLEGAWVNWTTIFQENLGLYFPCPLNWQNLSLRIRNLKRQWGLSRMSRRMTRL